MVTLLQCYFCRGLSGLSRAFSKIKAGWECSREPSQNFCLPVLSANFACSKPLKSHVYQSYQYIYSLDRIYILLCNPFTNPFLYTLILLRIMDMGWNGIHRVAPDLTQISALNQGTNPWLISRACSKLHVYWSNCGSPHLRAYTGLVNRHMFTFPQVIHFGITIN